MDPETETAADETTNDALTEGVEETAPVAEIETDTETPEPTPEQAAEARRAARLKAAEEAEQSQARSRAERAQRLEAAKEQAAQQAWRREQAEAKKAREDWEKQVAEQRALLTKGGPDALKALGITYEEWTRQYLEESSPEAETRRLREKLEAIEKREQEREAAAAKAAEERIEHGLFSTAISLLEKNAEQFPDAFDLPQNLQAAGIRRARAELVERLGRAPTYAEVLTRLDQEASALFTEAQKRRALRARPLPSDGETERDAALSATQGNPPRTLSNQLAGTKASKKPPLSEEELDRQLRAELREAIRKDTAGSR